MTLSHDQLRDLVLSFEELGPHERILAEAHLRDCAACSSLLERARQHERKGLLRGTLPSLDESPALDSSQRREADASLLALREKLNLGAEPAASREARARERRATREGRAWREDRPPSVLEILRATFLGSGRRRWALAAIPVAAALVWALVVLRPATRDSPAFLGAPKLVATSEMRGGGSEGFRTGEAFQIDLYLSRPAVVVVVHVDPRGVATLLHPSPAQPPDPSPAGALRLPDPLSGIEWRFIGVPGRETFLIAASRSADPDLASLRAGIQGLPRGSQEASVAAARVLLERAWSDLTIAVAEHR